MIITQIYRGVKIGGTMGQSILLVHGVSVGDGERIVAEGDTFDPHDITVFSPSLTLTPRRTLLIGPLFPQSSPSDKFE